MEIDIINRIRFDQNIVDRGVFEIFYWDNILKSLVKINWYDILEYDRVSMLVHDINTGKDSNIPLHRIKKITEKGKTIFERKF